MKIFANIILAAIAIVLSINIFNSLIDKNDVQELRNKFTTEEIEYVLEPKVYGKDTITINAQNATVLYEVDELFGDTTYNYIFITNNKAIKAISGKEYRLQEK
jgi:hypothetical protein